MTELHISCIEDLAALRRLADRKSLNIKISSTLIVKKYIGMLARYVIWALEPQGVARITLPKLEDDPCYGLVAKWPLVVQQIGRWLRNDGEIIGIDVSTFCITIRRTSSKTAGSWGCGLVVSGSESELPLIQKWIESITRQEDVSITDLAICGPSKAACLYKDIKVRFIPFDDANDLLGRFFICSKKNHLMKSLSGDKLLISHARISFDKSCLANMPAEFDLITPRVCLFTTSGIPYLDWNVVAVKHGHTVSHGGPLPIGYDRNNWRKYYPYSAPYIDGGLFAVSRVQFARVPMRSNAAWGEAEDVEWCADITADSGMVELAERSVAVSATNKLPRYFKYAKNPLYKVYQSVRLGVLNRKFG